MQINEFRSIVMRFADPGTELLVDGSRMAVSVNGDLIDASVTARSGEIFIDEGAGPEPANKWILNRLARLDLLANRLIETIPKTESFISPDGALLTTLEKAPDDTKSTTNDALAAASRSLEERSPLETTVLYITSDAGEGKTSVINELARLQAKAYSDRRSDWLLVPIPLGGRHFLRFDDITVGALQNRYRFPFLYYQSFLALVRMGVIVPAFDGFEEMFVETSSGEALSAMGILVGSLESRGAMVIAARKAYFDFENLKTSERLFDTIRTLSVGFGKLELHRWGRRHFVEYCTKRGLTNCEEVYGKVSERLTTVHPLLTRAVLANRLVTVAKDSSSLDDLLVKLQTSGQDFFAVFVKGLVEREVEKWIDRSGTEEIGSPLLTVEEHFSLLSQIALAMWEARVDYLKKDTLEFVADFFCESEKKTGLKAQQIRQRILGHALLVSSANASGAVEFDHDEFRLFYLGEAVANILRPINEQAKAEVLSVFRRGVLARPAQHAVLRALARDRDVDALNVVRFLLGLVAMEARASFVHENCTDLVIRLLNGQPGAGMIVTNLTFGPDALQDRQLSGIVFENCYFAPTSLEKAVVENCVFRNVQFAQLRLFESTVLIGVKFSHCTVDAVSWVDRGRDSWAPDEIRSSLGQVGISFDDDLELSDTGPSSSSDRQARDQEIRDVEKIVRYFMRSTHISESVVRIKLGGRGQVFLDETVPQLLKRGIFEESPNLGAGNQRRFWLGVPLGRMSAELVSSDGSFEVFLSKFDS